MRRILIADDDPIARHLLRRELEKKGFDIEETVDGTEAWARLSREDSPPIAILDWSMPGLDGPEICRRLRALPLNRYTYLLLLTGRADKVDLVIGLEAGADDYLTKPVHAAELTARLEVAARILALENRLVEARDEMEIQANRDVLTGLPNRRGVIEAMGPDTRGPQRGLAVLLADLDHFKSVNDAYGHAAGDAVLVEVARRMSEAIRSEDTAGRYGGEEFLVVLPGANEATGLNLGERIRHAVGACPVIWEGVAIPVTVSIGLACRDSGAAENRESLLHRADGALYEAKRSGRNRVLPAPLLQLASSAA
jgi:two-component system, cell cycle response regulator